MEDGGCLWCNDIRFRFHPLPCGQWHPPRMIGLGCRGISSGSPFGGLRLFYSQTSRLWASFPMYSTKEKDVIVYSAETNAHHGHPMRLILYSLPYGLGHPFHFVCKITKNITLHQTSLLKIEFFVALQHKSKYFYFL